MSPADSGSAGAGMTLAAGLWVSRLRLLLAIGLVWAGLHFLIGGTLLPRGLNRPVVILPSGAGALAAVAVALVLWAGTYAGTLLAGWREPTCGLLIAGAALALWSVGGGTIDSWLMLRNPPADGPRAGPYWALLLDYLFLLLVTVGLVLISEAAAGRAAVGGAGRRRSGAGPRIRLWPSGLGALLTTVVVAAALLFVLTGPRAGHTWRGQTFFAVAAAFVLGVMAARRLTGVRHPLCYWPAPFIVGTLGLLLCGLSPALPAPYDRLDMIPAWGLARPLPVEMVGVGLAAVAWTLRTPRGFGGSAPG